MKKQECGFVCQKCGKYCIGKIIDSRLTIYGKRRRRICNECGERFTTVEHCVWIRKYVGDEAK